MTFEGTAYFVDTSIEERICTMKHGVGDSLKELIENMF